MDENDANWFVPCPDEDVYKAPGAKPRGQLGFSKLSSADASRLFTQMEKNEDGILPLRWTCPGRRPVTPSDEEEDEEEDASSEEEQEAAGQAAAGPDTSAMDFDFEDEGPAAAALTPRRMGGPSRELKGSARKKQTSFNGVLENMKRHQKMDAANRAKK